MYEMSLLEAFASYKVRPARRTRSAMTSDGGLVISCWYGGFKRAEAAMLQYEEDLAGQTNEIAAALRTHLLQALSNRCEVRVIVAVAIAATVKPKADSEWVTPAHTSYYARKDLVGRVCSFDGERFTVEFHRTPTPELGHLSKSARSQGKARLAGR